MTAPLFEEPATFADERLGVRVWLFDESATLFDQQTNPELTAEIAAFLTSKAEAEVQRRWVRAGRKVSYVHDWRSFLSYDARARLALIDWGRTARPHTQKTTVCFSSEASPFVRIAAATGITVLKAVGIPIEQVDSLDAVVASLTKK
jgi:hypothetical protein